TASSAAEGTLRALGRNQWRLRAPATSGNFVVQINSPAQSVRLNVFVMVPFTEIKGEYLQGYRIGEYPDKPLRGQKAYAYPTGFIKVTASNQDVFLTPHFQLKQFLCKQESAFPKFVVLHERLLLALEFILHKVQAEGYKINTFGFISGYRTPFYNGTIENTPNSRHVYGDAADIFIDANNDAKMDDLNRDGRINERDVRVMYNLLDALSEDAEFQPFLGGLGFYKRTSAHEGFVHVDTRGVKVEW
ncbi:peptidase M15A, partial [candidate division KSB1 bacterium]|nr:peptidase M15A [candidate division KSB1 bacterium]